MYLLVILLPLLGSIIVGFSGRFLGRFGGAFVSTFMLFLTWLVALFIFFEVCWYKNVVSIKFYKWLLIDIYSII